MLVELLGARAWAADDPRLATGYDLLDQSRPLDAIGQFEAVLKADPANAKAEEGEAWAYYATRDFARAAEHADRRLALTPADLDWRRNWALIVSAVPARQDELVSKVRGWANEAPASQSAQLLLGRVLADAGQYDEGRRVLGAILASDPKSTEALRTLASIERWDQHYGEARALLDRAVKQDPSDASLRADLQAVTKEASSFDVAKLQPTLPLSLAVIVGALLLGQLSTRISVRTHVVALVGTGALTALALAALFIVPLGSPS